MIIGMSKRPHRYHQPEDKCGPRYSQHSRYYKSGCVYDSTYARGTFHGIGQSAVQSKSYALNRDHPKNNTIHHTTYS